MKLYLTILFGCLCLAASVRADDDEANEVVGREEESSGREGIREREGYLYQHRERLGRFAEEPFLQLYEYYAVSFILPNFPLRDNDDYRNYVPSSEDCSMFFSDFLHNGYQLENIDGLIVLDACLGHTFNSTWDEIDPSLKGDDKLKEIYYGTDVNSMELPAKDCVADLLYDSVRARKQYSEVTCNNHWLQLFYDFAECHHLIPEDRRQSDSYMRIAFDLVKRQAQKCFKAEIKALNEALRSKYANNPFRDVLNKMSLNSISRQAARRYWPKQVTELLKAVQGTQKEINLREVNAIVRGISENRVNFKTRLLNNMAEFATKTLKPDRSSKKVSASGKELYSGLINRLCNFFRSSDNKKYYDYAKSFIRLVNLLKYPQILGVTMQDFERDVMVYSYEAAPIYYCVSSCNLLTFTYGKYVETPRNSKLSFEVHFERNTTGMVQWPTVYY